MNLKDLRDRKFLQNLRESAERSADQCANEHWKKDYIALAEAADHLDARIARTEAQTAGNSPEFAEELRSLKF